MNPTSDSVISSQQTTLQKFTHRFFSSVVLALLFVSIVAGTSENMHSQMLKLGVYFWDDYFVLRGEMPVVDCDLS